MNSKAKNPKASRTTSHGHLDRLSSLPESILCHIHSFLSTKYAAATSTLSTHWKYIFLLVPKIDLDDSLILHLQQHEDNNANREKLGRSFVDFVNRRLMLCKAHCIEEFRLKCQKLPETSLTKSWIPAVLWRDIQVLDICILEYHDNCISLPSEIFLCKTLVVLKLHGRLILKVPKFVCLQNLKVLHLEFLFVQCGSGDLLFGSDYPLLEDF